ERLRATREAAFAPEAAALPLDELIDRVVDPLVAFYVAHPGFLALFAGADASPRVAAVTREFHEGVVERVGTLEARAAALPAPSASATACSSGRALPAAQAAAGARGPPLAPRPATG